MYNFKLKISIIKFRDIINQVDTNLGTVIEKTD